jgi:hypothetical protein
MTRFSVLSVSDLSSPQQMFTSTATTHSDIEA